MRVEQITSAGNNRELQDLYQTAFPEEEQIPWPDLMRLVGEMPLDFSAYYEGEELIFFSLSIPVHRLTGSGILPSVKN